MNNKGFAPIYFIIAAGIILLGGGGYFGYQTLNKPQDTSPTQLQATESLQTLPQVNFDEEKQKLTTEINNLKNQNQNLVKENSNLKTQVSQLNKTIKDKNEDISDIKKDLSKNKDSSKEINQKIKCLELIKKTPEGGLAGYIGVDIEKYYKATLDRLNEVKSNPTRPDDPEETAAEISFYEKKLSEAKPMYDNYIKECK